MGAGREPDWGQGGGGAFPLGLEGEAGLLEAGVGPPQEAQEGQQGLLLKNYFLRVVFHQILFSPCPYFQQLLKEEQEEEEEAGLLVRKTFHPVLPSQLSP